MQSFCFFIYLHDNLNYVIVSCNSLISIPIILYNTVSLTRGYTTCMDGRVLVWNLSFHSSLTYLWKLEKNNFWWKNISGFQILNNSQKNVKTSYFLYMYRDYLNILLWLTNHITTLSSTAQGLLHQPITFLNQRTCRVFDWLVLFRHSRLNVLHCYYTFAQNPQLVFETLSLFHGDSHLESPLQL